LAFKATSEFEKAFFARFAELAAKVSLLAALSRLSRNIEPCDVEFAIDVVDTQWSNAQSLFAVSATNTQAETNTKKVLELIREKGTIAKSDLVKKTQWLRATERNEIIKTLLEGEQITRLERQTRGRKKIIFALNS